MGFLIKQSTVVWGITVANSDLLISNALISIIGTCGLDCLILLQIRNPFMPGIRMSEITVGQSLPSSKK